MKKIIHIVGARPQFIKLAPMIHNSRNVFENIIIHTGQHYDKAMSDNIFEDLDIPEPDYNLEVGSGSHGQQTAKMLEGIELILIKEKPDAVIVYGDTNSTLSGALAAVKLNIFTAHIEACLRSFNRAMPEEINRICTDHISDTLFVPTSAAMQNATNEGLGTKAHLVGDIMTDSLAYGLQKSEIRLAILQELNLTPESYYLLTLHRPYTVDEPEKLISLLTKLNCLKQKVLFPIHPRTSNILRPYDISSLSNIELSTPRSYLDFITLMNNSKAILTDSGGIQKEAYILKKLCITLRTETEWIETVKSGWNLLVNPSEDNLINIIESQTVPDNYLPIFGNSVSIKIISKLDSFLH